MPLSKKRNRDRMRDIRATCVQPNPVHLVRPLVQPKLDPSPRYDDVFFEHANRMNEVNSPFVQPKQEKLAELRKLIDSMQPVQPIPLYNPSVHRPGDRVLVKPPYSKKLVETVIPELDDDGNPYI